MRVLIVEDDAQLSDFLVNGFGESGHVAESVADGESGLHRARSEPYDVLIVDRMLPRLDGISLIEHLRAGDTTEGFPPRSTPVLILSALGEVDDRVVGLRAGGDDYLAKPFAFAELLARAEALVRRVSVERSSNVLRVGDLELDRLKRIVRRAGKTIDLQPREFKLLEFLMRHCGQVVTRTMLLEGVWDYHFDPQTNIIDVHVSRLRAKIDKGFDTPLISTVRGAGYRMESIEPADAKTE